MIARVTDYMNLYVNSKCLFDYVQVGEDIWGDKYIENLQKQKVDVTHVKKTPNFSSGIAQINVADSGDNQIVIVVGANTQLSEADVEAAREDVEAAQVLLCQLETSWQVAVKAMEICKGVLKQTYK